MPKLTNISHYTPNLIILGQDGEYQTGHENDHEHRRIAGVGVFLTQGVSASRATSQDYEPTVSVKGGLMSESFSLRLFPQENLSNHYPQLFHFR